MGAAVMRPGLEKYEILGGPIDGSLMTCTPLGCGITLEIKPAIVYPSIDGHRTWIASNYKPTHEVIYDLEEHILVYRTMRKL